MASKAELLRQANRNKEKQIKEQEESVVDIFIDNKPAESKEEVKKEPKPKKSAPKPKSKVAKFNTKKQTKSIQRTIYLEPRTDKQLQELLEAIKNETPDSSIKTMNELINEILRMFLDEE